MIAALAAAVFFAWLASQVVRGDAATFDLTVRNAIHAWASPRFTDAMRGVTQLGGPWFLLPLGLLLPAMLARRGRRRAAIVLATATFGAQILDAILKAIFHRVRPDTFFGLPQPESYSFPSGHTMVSTCFYWALAAIADPGRAPRAMYWSCAAILSALVGFSRIYLGYHYPTDVLGGYAAAIVVLTIAIRPQAAAIEREISPPSH